MQWVLTVLAVFWAWEVVRSLLPEQVPGILYPVIVGGLAYGAAEVDERLLTAAAVAGAVGILHTLVRLAGAAPVPSPVQLRMPRRSRDPLPRGVGSRVPSLP